MRIGIAGAGLLGRLLAYQLSIEGNEVEVFDLATSGELRAASPILAAAWSAAGMLRPVIEMDVGTQAVFELGLRSLQIWPTLLKELCRHVEYSNKGYLLVAHRSDWAVANHMVNVLQQKVPPNFMPSYLMASHLKEIEPDISGAAHVWYLPQGGYIDNEAAMSALFLKASSLGVNWHWNCLVEKLVDGKIDYRCDQKTIESAQFDHVFDVRGVGAKADIDVRGVRGEIFLLHAPEVTLHRPVHLVHPRHSVYMTPRSGNRILVGASEIESEDRSPVSVRTTLELLSSAHSILPGLAEARILRSESNLRPAMPDNQPHISQEKKLTRINGLYRHGWLIAPALIFDAMKGASL